MVAHLLGAGTQGRGRPMQGLKPPFLTRKSTPVIVLLLGGYLNQGWVLTRLHLCLFVPILAFYFYL